MNAYELLSSIIKELVYLSEPGVDTLTLNNVAKMRIEENGAISCNKNYLAPWSERPYMYETCLSVNQVIAHGFPSEYVLKEGDTMIIDMAVKKDGVCADGATTVYIGKEMPDKIERLMRYGKKALYRGMSVLKDGVTVEEIAKKIDETAGWGGFTVNRMFTGHGIGKEMHEQPHIYHTTNYLHDTQEHVLEYQKYMDIVLHAGQKICLEPILSNGERYGVRARNEWEFYSQKGFRSVMFEHTILIEENGYKVLTSHISEE